MDDQVVLLCAGTYVLSPEFYKSTDGNYLMEICKYLTDCICPDTAIGRLIKSVLGFCREGVCQSRLQICQPRPVCCVH